MEDFLYFLSVLCFSISPIFADSVSITDPIACVYFHLYHSLFFHSLDTNLFFSLALFLLHESEYIGSPSFALKKL